MLLVAVLLAAVDLLGVNVIPSMAILGVVGLVIGIGLHDNIGQVRDAIGAIIAADKRMLKGPKPAIAVGELADSSVNLNVRPWVSNQDYWSVGAD